MEDTMEDTRKKRASPDSVAVGLPGAGDCVDVKPDLGTLRKRLRSSPGQETESNDVEVVDAPIVYPDPNNTREGGDDDDIQLVGTVNEQKLPHMRQHCLEHLYQPDSTVGVTVRETQNQRFCDLCYCYVCDVKAPECKEWKTHCFATDQGHRASYWRNQRALHKNPAAEQANATTILGYRMYEDAMYDNIPKPNTQCRHCDWSGWLKISPKNAGSYDWCRDCGRVASVSSLGKEQSQPLNPKDEIDILLGAKTIPFRLKTRDPRKMDQYKQKWEENQGMPEWEYNQTDMEEETFQHRFGKRPSLEMIFSSIPILQEDKLPDDARSTLSSDYYSDMDRTSATEVDSLLIDERNHRLILIFLLLNASTRLNASIKASWNRQTSTGVS
jgi:hypothetical protein